MPPGELLLKMQQCGLHLIPSRVDYQEANITEKLVETEEQALFDISSNILTYAFRSSK